MNWPLCGPQDTISKLLLLSMVLSTTGDADPCMAAKSAGMSRGYFWRAQELLYDAAGSPRGWQGNRRRSILLMETLKCPICGRPAAMLVDNKCVECRNKNRSK